MNRDDELIEISGWTDDDAGVLYAASVLEELALIELVERLNELNQNKMLSIGAGAASNLLHEFWDQGYKRMPPARRAAVYDSLFGAGNEAFAGLLETLTTALAGDGDAAAVAPAAAALRENLAEHSSGDGIAKAADELRSAYGATDMWQLIENVQREFGGDADVQDVRERAVSGALIVHRLPELCEGAAGDVVSR